MKVSSTYLHRVLRFRSMTCSKTVVSNVGMKILATTGKEKNLWQLQYVEARHFSTNLARSLTDYLELVIDELQPRNR